jgi:cytochrome c biogenesis factor
MLRFFLSIKTYLWVTGISIGVFLIGSIYIPRNLAVFSLINDMPLLRWLSQNSNIPDRIFWIYLLVGFMLLLWICTLICSIDAIIKKTTRKNMIKVLSPQILHIAIIFVLLGHGVSAVTGYRQDVPMKINDEYKVKGFDLKINNIEFFKNPGENSTRWRVHLEIDNQLHMIELGKPAFYNGVGFFAKSAQKKKMKAIIGLVHDPGVIWEIIGAVVFVVSAFGVFYIKLNEKPLSSGLLKD